MKPCVDYIERLAGVDPRLVFVVLSASIKYSRETGNLVRVTSGLRTQKQQNLLVAQGKSQTRHSYHVKGRAIDLAIIVDDEATWNHWDYEELNIHVQTFASRCGLHVTWGGSWATLIDAVHWQLEASDDWRNRTGQAIPAS